MRVADWLARNAEPDDIVVSSEKAGQLIASRSGLIAYLGHPIETLEYQKKSGQVASLFASPDVILERDNWLYESGARWIVCGPPTPDLPCNLTSSSHLREVFEQAGVVIYQVVHP